MENNNEYYIRNKKKIIKEFKSLVKAARKVISLDLNSSTISTITQQAQLELESLLSKLPFVGGDKSPFTPLMIQSAMTISLYKACKPLDLPIYEVGRIIFEIAERYSQSFSPIKKWIYRNAIFSKKMKKFWRNWLNESQKQEYPENWVGNYIETKPNTSDYGFNFTECGMLKLAQKENAEEIVPYACLCDYARMRAFGIGFKRTKTLIAGENICDFRFIKGYKTPRGWPPEDLDENKLFYASLTQKL